MTPLVGVYFDRGRWAVVVGDVAIRVRKLSDARRMSRRIPGARVRRWRSIPSAGCRGWDRP